MYLRKIGFDTLRGFSFKSIQHLHLLDFLCHSLQGIRTGTNFSFYTVPKFQYRLVIYDGIFIIHINITLSFLSPSFYFANSSANLASVCTIFSITYKVIVRLIYLLFTYFIPCSNIFIFFDNFISLFSFAFAFFNKTISLRIFSSYVRNIHKLLFLFQSCWLLVVRKYIHNKFKMSF